MARPLNLLQNTEAGATGVRGPSPHRNSISLSNYDKRLEAYLNYSDRIRLLNQYKL